MEKSKLSTKNIVETQIIAEKLGLTVEEYLGLSSIELIEAVKRKHSYSESFRILRTLRVTNKVKLSLKRSIKDCFGTWLYVKHATNAKTMDKNNYKFIAYSIIANGWLWAGTILLLSYYVSPFYLLLIIFYTLVKSEFKRYGKEKLIKEGYTDEAILKYLYSKELVSIRSKKTRKSEATGKQIPVLLIAAPQDWEKEIKKAYFLSVTGGIKLEG
jgi:hypothetical protein